MVDKRELRSIWIQSDLVEPTRDLCDCKTDAVNVVPIQFQLAVELRVEILQGLLMTMLVLPIVP